MYCYSTGTSLKRVVKLPKLRPGDVYRVGHLVRQDAVAEDSIFYTNEMTLLLSCSGMMYDHGMPLLSRARFCS